jgi:MoaA/NifB/PqqE/SkfB family radical SAM enzyme
VRGLPHELQTLEVTPQQHAEAVAYVSEYFGRGTGEADLASRFTGRLFAARKSFTMGRISGVAAERKEVPYVACNAGLLNVVIYEQGDVHSCEIIDRPLANLRDVDLDFMKIWNGGELRAFREEILARRCACTHETNVSTNFYFSPRSYLRLARAMVRTPR